MTFNFWPRTKERKDKEALKRNAEIEKELKDAEDNARKWAIEVTCRLFLQIIKEI